MDLNPTTKLLGKDIMSKLDYLVIKNGFWRVSTSENFTYHMGNSTEKWMYDKLDKLEVLNQLIEEPKLKDNKVNKIANWLKIGVFGTMLFSSTFIWKKFLAFKGLTKQEAKSY